MLAVGFMAAATFPARADAAARADWPQIELALVQENFALPVHVTHAGDGSGRLFVVEKAGVVKIIDLVRNTTLAAPFLDVHERVNSDCNECGLLSMAFPPDFASKGYFFVYYNAKGNPTPGPEGENDPAEGNDSVLARFRITANSDVADSNSEEQILLVNQPYANHNGGQLAFGKDGYLYLGLGDGGSGGDPENAGQRLDTLLGKILRLQVGTTGGYTIPADNPFVNNASVKGEIWSYGWRNPWRFAFDRQTGDLYVGDVGQNAYEEVNYEPAGAGGKNYGWRLMEGSHCYNADSCDRSALTLPFFDYGRELGASVSGGVVYRGAQYSDWQGVYFFADFASGRIWGARRPASGVASKGSARKSSSVWSVQELLDSPYNIASFGEDENGAIYLADYSGGGVYRLQAEAAASTVTPAASPTSPPTPATPTPRRRFLPIVFTK
jgi:glucose/arabinose dehydrogenase